MKPAIGHRISLIVEKFDILEFAGEVSTTRGYSGRRKKRRGPGTGMVLASFASKTGRDLRGAHEPDPGDGRWSGTAEWKKVEAVWGLGASVAAVSKAATGPCASLSGREDGEAESTVQLLPSFALGRVRLP